MAGRLSVRAWGILFNHQEGFSSALPALLRVRDGIKEKKSPCTGAAQHR